MTKQYKVNSQISVPQVRLIGEDGKQIGVLSRDQALDFALGQGVDLVLIGDTAKPPVAKAIDFKKFIYQENKKEKEAKKGQKSKGGSQKEVRVGGPFAAPADVKARIDKVTKLLADGYSVRLVIKFTGRQLSHQEFGHRIVNQFKTQLAGIGKVDREPKMEGRQLVTIFSAGKKTD